MTDRGAVAMTPDQQAVFRRLSAQLRKVVEGFESEAMNGVICTPPGVDIGNNDCVGDWDAAVSRRWCARCKSRWAILRTLPDELDAAVAGLLASSKDECGNWTPLKAGVAAPSIANHYGHGWKAGRDSTGLLARQEEPPTLKENSMTFGEAIEAMKQGKSVARAGWNGKNMHIYLEDGYSQTVGDGVFKGQQRHYEPVICMFNAQGKHQPGWLANQPDILATDWDVVTHG